MDLWKGIDKIIKLSIEYPLKLIPKAYKDEPSITHSLYKWFLVGLFFRIIVMPFAFHGDLFSTYHRSYLLAFNGSMQFFNPPETIQAISLWIISLIVPLKNILVWSGSTSVSTTHWLGSLDYDHIFTTIFLLKIPYLFFDIAICILFLHIFKTEIDKGLRAFIFWILNPIVIFAVYIFGRYEVIPIFFIFLCIYSLKESNLIIAGLSFGIAIMSRYYALLLLPLLLFIYFNSWEKQMKMLFFVSIPLILCNLIPKFYSGKIPSIGFAESHFVDYPLGLNISIGGFNQVLYIFIIMYICVIFYFYFKKQENNSQMVFTISSLIVLLLFYATSMFHPQYFIWFIPFLALYYGYFEDNQIIELHCLQVICFIVYTFYWDKALASWMFASIYPKFFIALPSPVDLINILYSSEIILNIFRSIFSAVSFFMIFKIFSGRGEKKSNEA